MTIHWKAVEQYFTVVLFVNPLTRRVKPWVIQSFLNFDSMDRILECDHLLESTLMGCCLFFDLTQFVILQIGSIFELALSGVWETWWLSGWCVGLGT